MREDYIKCPLCGYTFMEKKDECSPSCPLGKSCQFLCCPQCHYRFPAESKVAGLIRKLLVRGRRKGEEKK